MKYFFMRIVLVFAFIGIQFLSQAEQGKARQLPEKFSSAMKRPQESIKSGAAAQALSINENFHRQTPRDHSSPLHTD